METKKGKCRGKRNSTILFMVAFVLAAGSLGASAAAQETPSEILFDLKTGSAYIDGDSVHLEAPARILQNRLFVPVRFLAERLGFPVEWDVTSKTIRLQTKRGEVTLNQPSGRVTIGEQTLPFAAVAAIVDDKLYLAARQTSEWMDLSVEYDPAMRTVLIKKKALQAENQRPVARFTTDKKVYRIGEPVQYIDLSYDPDGEGYTLMWSGKRDAFFQSGKHAVSLRVKDSQGNLSEPFVKLIEVSDEVLTDEEGFPFYFSPLSPERRPFPLHSSRYADLPVLKKVQRAEKDTDEEKRTLIISNSPETFREFGVLYQEQVKAGKYRFYATHSNGTKELAQFYLLVTNRSSEPLSVRTTNRGEAKLTQMPELAGAQALVDWYMEKRAEQQVSVEPGRSYVYFKSEPMYPGQVLHFLHDVEIDGKGEVTFIVVPADSDISRFADFPRLEKDRHIRGTYEGTRLAWTVDASQVKDRPARIVIGENNEEWVKGRDFLTGAEAANKGNYGITYEIQIDKPGKAAIALVPRGGLFKGVLLYNGTIVPVPKSGIIQPNHAFLLGRTTGSEERIEIELIPPSGSYLPFDILLYPLRDLK
ncbi:copper amine oxidase N-terminal domain-containing protein [Bacillaceae bacterium]